MTNLQEKPKNIKVRIGRVVSDKPDKTVIVAVEELTRHRVFRKYMRKRVKFHAHDVGNECKEGDKVEIVETSPLSKLKRWRVSRIIEKAEKA